MQFIYLLVVRLPYSPIIRLSKSFFVEVTQDFREGIDAVYTSKEIFSLLIDLTNVGIISEWPNFRDGNE